jgi:DNA-binding transcriptional MerR regulator
MKIGELAKLSGMAASRIRFYESTGLIETVDRQSNGYREYPKEALLILELINAAKRAGFSLSEIKALLPNGAGRWNHGELVVSLEKKAADIALLQERLRQAKDGLLQLVALIKTRPHRSACADNVREALNVIRSASPGRKKSRARA